MTRTWSSATPPSCSPGCPSGWLASSCPRALSSLEFRLHHQPDRRYWLVIQRDTEPYGCLTDPFLDVSRYVYLESAMSTLLALARGRLNWTDAFADGSLTAAGDPDLLSQVTGWFQRTSKDAGKLSA